jgi:hypothetical protein
MTARTLSRQQLLLVARAVVSKGGHLRCRVHGYSMRPMITDGDEVVLGAVRSSTPHIGEVILVDTSRGPKLHRVIECGQDSSGNWLRVRGDTQIGAGEVVRLDALYARVVSVHRPLLKTIAIYATESLRWIPRWLPGRRALAARP